VLNIRLEAAQSLLTRLRAVKSRADLEGMILAQRLAEKAFEQLLPLISTDVTEKELAAELIYRFLKLGAEGASFDQMSYGVVEYCRMASRPTRTSQKAFSD
jgi:Xaa-Pro aminopeptidase